MGWTALHSALEPGVAECQTLQGIAAPDLHPWDKWILSPQPSCRHWPSESLHWHQAHSPELEYDSSGNQDNDYGNGDGDVQLGVHTCETEEWGL